MFALPPRGRLCKARQIRRRTLVSLGGPSNRGLAYGKALSERIGWFRQIRAGGKCRPAERG